LVAIVEVLFPHVVCIVLRRRPIVVVGKPANSSCKSKSVLMYKELSLYIRINCFFTNSPFTAFKLSLAHSL
ncbi:MAG: hypothetical protein KAU83_00180, partial [Bacteroidales bacterium]|nr:hypothetical protein [Bacteroidales bacterium]